MRLLLCLLFGAVLAVMAVSAQAAFVLPAWLPYGASVKLPAYAAVIVAACLGGLTATALIAGRAPQHRLGLLTSVRLIRRFPVVAFAGAWLFLVLPVAAATGRLALLPMSLGLGAACAAAVAAQRTGEMLRNGGKLELQHDILGIGGGLGGWRMSQPAGAAILCLILLGTAAALSVAALQAAMSAAGFEAAEAVAVPPWITVLALHALGFGGDVLGPVAEAVAAENQSNFVKELLWTLPKTASAGKGIAIVTANASSPSSTAYPPGSPVFFISKDQLQTYDRAIGWLSSVGVFEGVIHEHTAGQDPPGEQPAASG